MLKLVSNVIINKGEKMGMLKKLQFSLRISTTIVSLP